MMARLAGKRALITGAGGGIGRGCAEEFAKHGAQVMAVDLNAGALADLPEGIHTHAADLMTQAGAEGAVAAAIKAMGGIDCLVNAAAVADFLWIEEMELHHWQRTLSGELDTVFLMCKAAWPHLKTSGRAAIVNFASANAYVALKGSPALAHCAGKGGVLAMTRQLAMEGRGHGIRANSIAPGMIVTPATAPVLEKPEVLAAVHEKLMVDRLGQPEDIALGAVYLCSDEAGYVTGTDLSIDGGALAW
jgi:NAD(P)-dependent dehydrogenase (short-subunit alcohol dehydrogenase family)